ncbi:protein-export chaperone SecB [Treponema sp. OMZ 788]|uniref:protein-export chaperone SecB n=1 Tax=Treponema sp. OMZ 788 TaxID=2563664 RepID=UPI0020A338F1|nr:protein-export chaperone SecB [Treponema sp. OMZ 788]UTC64426.1 protein-export chaperone SecB [Treponema sp. OMZ 788]
MSNYDSVLHMQAIVFDNIEFERKGFKNDNELEFNLEIQIGTDKEHRYKVTLILKGNKKDEYEFSVSLSGFFMIEDVKNMDDKLKQNLISKNAAAIMMPYLRSEVTLLTSQPGTDSVVLPIFNINKIID